MIEIHKLSKDFGPIRAVDAVSFTVKPGEVLGFLGPNGAGKSTTMKMVTGFLSPTSGTARICGFDIQEQPMQAKKCLGYLPEGAPAYADMTPDAYLDFIADVRGLTGDDKRRRVEAVVRQVQLERYMHQRIETLSKGFKRRVGLAQAILHDPRVLVLDEPTDGLDPNQKHSVRELIRSMSKDKAIVLSTHILEEVSAVCTRVMIIAGGRIKYDGTAAQFEAEGRPDEFFRRVTTGERVLASVS
jgi:ABC-2 type transport system ATP-binding protein